MRNRLLLITALALLAICVTQQLWIYHLHAAPVPKAIPAAVPITYNSERMADFLVPPPGARDVANEKDSSKFGGITIGDIGFDGCLWIETAGMTLGRSAGSRQERIAEIGAWYAKRVAMAIPDSYVERAVDLAQNIEAQSLHCYFVVRHPAGVVVVVAGYKSTRDGNQISDMVKVQVSTLNFEGNVRTMIKLK